VNTAPTELPFSVNRAIIIPMGTQRDRILVVENDPAISDFLARQSLQSAGYQVQIVGDATNAIAQALQFAPDAIVVDFFLPGLSGKDLLVALGSQGVNAPVIVLARKGMEADVIQAFRLGASDYLPWPVREPEVVAVVERVMRQVRERREREQLARQLQQTNQELQNRVRELTAIFSIAKAVTSVTDQRVLFDRIIEGAVKLTSADAGWFLLRNEGEKPFILVAQCNLPEAIASALNQPWDDGISALVGASGEPLSLHGNPLKRFKIYALGQSILIVPLRVQKQVIGLLTVLRKDARQFLATERSLLEAMADFASISLVNARLFRALEERARFLQQAAENARAVEKIKDQLFEIINRELQISLQITGDQMDTLSGGITSKLNTEQRQALQNVRVTLARIHKIVEAIPPLQQETAFKPSHAVNLAEVVRRAAGSLERIAGQNRLSLAVSLPDEPVMASADPGLVQHILVGLLTNAIKFSPGGGQINIQVEQTPDRIPHIAVRDPGIGIDPRYLPRVFDPGFRITGERPAQFGGLGIGLSLVKELVNLQGGKIWAESKPGQGSTFHFTLLPARL
jgi:signal transduction histidine kinase/DNA-binding response OmpR family regulator